jgi:hypothetical protein
MMPTIQSICDDESQARDIEDLVCKVTSWDSVHVFDWEVKVPNTTVDVLHGVHQGLSNHRGVFRFLKSLNNPSIEMLQSGKYSSCLFAEEQHPSVAAAGVFTTSTSLDVNDHAATMYESRS